MPQTTYIEPEGFKGTTGPLTNRGFDVFDAKGKRIADSWTIQVHDGEGKHNAQLFAASKDLLREAQDLMTRVKRAYSILHKDPVTSNWGMLDTTGMERAINKALGNPSNIIDNG